MKKVLEQIVKYEAKRSLSDNDIFYALTGRNLPEGTTLRTLYNAAPLALQYIGFTDKQISVIIAAQEFALRASAEPEKYKICSSLDAYKLIKPFLSELSEERFFAIHLKRNNSVIAVDEITRGTDTATIVDLKQIARRAIMFKSTAIIFAHNHPSGNLRPSNADVEITKKGKEALKLFDITLVDHIIVGHNEYYSFADSHSGFH